MEKKHPTKAMKYCQNVIETIDALLASESPGQYAKLGRLLMERPKTLRCAMSAYFYKAMMRRI